MILLASLLVGRALLLALGRREASFLEGAVGLAVLILVCTVAIRLPGDGGTSLALCAILVVASLALLWSAPGGDPARPGGRASRCQSRCSSASLASLPFIANGHIGIPGVGLNNDMAMHLVDTDYLLDPTGPEPQSIVNGYPLGPAQPGRHRGPPARHRAAAGLARAAGRRPGAHRRSPRLRVLRELPGWRHILARPRSSRLAYLTASVLGIAGFKELIAGMFLIAFALGLREIERESRRADRDRDRARTDHGGDGARSTACPASAGS